MIVGYAMSRENKGYLTARNLTKWKDAYDEAATALSRPAATFKSLRDEFDPLHGNGRRGWHGRELRTDRLQVYLDLQELGGPALFALVDRILARDDAAVAEVVSVLDAPPARKAVANLEKRLLTGAAAEDFFMSRSGAILGIAPENLIDKRRAACGYDFTATDAGRLAIEVKGLATDRGSLLFTEREWQEARARGSDYKVVVVGNVDEFVKSRDASVVKVKVVPDPHRNLAAQCAFRQTVTATWQSPFAF